MARLYPDINKSRVIFASRAEELFYNECRRSLGSAWRVIYSVTLSSLEENQGLKDNEMDFVLYHPRYGVFIVEVKGGRIRFDKESNNFFSVNRLGQEFSIKNPFAQALAWKSRLIRLFREKNIRVPVTQLVCFPNVFEKEFPTAAAIENELIIGRERLANLEASLKEIVNKVQPEKFLRFDDCGEAIENVLVGGDFCTKLYIRDYIDTHENRVKDVEGVHESLITPIASSKRLGIEGEAGTGKTVLGINLARHFRDRGLSVLVLSSNDMLNVYLRELVGSQISVKSYVALGEENGVDLLTPPPTYTGSREDWVQFEAPDRVVNAITASSLRYDVIVCDEAQDVQPFWWDMVERLINTNNPENRLYVMFDRSQGVFGSGGSEKSFVPDDVLPVAPPYFPLVNNYRTTREVATFARYFRTGKHILESHTARLGYMPQIITYTTADEAKKKLETLLHMLIKQEGLQAEEIALLSARRPNQEPSIISGVKQLSGIPLNYLQATTRKESDKLFVSGEVTVSTVSGYKGLESKVGILINFSEYNMPLSNPIMASLMYVASTRAKHLLYIFVKQDDSKRQAMDAALRQIKLSGGIVIDSFDPEYELIGEVTHYNPERFGWIRVHDPRFPKGNVMFFPTDVEKSKLKAVRVGDKLKFRPRLEGEATIACDLQVVTA